MMHDENNIHLKKNILTYSELEQRKNGITTIGTYFKIFLFMFPAIPLAVALFSCFVYKLTDSQYKLCFSIGLAILSSFLVFRIIVWIKDIFTVYMIDQSGDLYYLHVSIFWYKIKNKMFLLNQQGYVRGRLMRLIYMVKYIKTVVESVSEEVELSDLIELGRLVKIEKIYNLDIDDKRIILHAYVKGKSGAKNKKIKIRKVYDKMRAFEEFLIAYKEFGAKKALETDFKKKDDGFMRLLNRPSRKKRFLKFNYWLIGITLWLCVITISGDLNILSKINSGEIKKTECTQVSTSNNEEEKLQYIIDGKEYFAKSDKLENKLYYEVDNPEKYYLSSEYGILYKPIMVCFLAIEIVYLIWTLIDKIFDKEDDKQDIS